MYIYNKIPNMVYTHLNTCAACTGCLHYNKVYTTKYGIHSFKYQVPVQHVLDVYTTTKFIQPNMVYTHLNTKYLCSMYWMFTLQQSLYNQIWYTLI